MQHLVVLYEIMNEVELPSPLVIISSSQVIERSKYSKGIGVLRGHLVVWSRQCQPTRLQWRWEGGVGSVGGREAKAADADIGCGNE